MAIYHLSVKTVSRSAGRSATAAAAYRAGVEIADERTGEIHDYTRKGGVESAELVLPAGAPEWAADRAALWNAAEQAETRKNSTVAREFEIALPEELSPAERQRLALDFAREIVERHGCAADVAIHAPGKEGDNRNHHAHILLSTRRLGPGGFTEKTRELDDQKTGPQIVTQWRERFASLQNERLREAGIEARVDHRTLEAQGIDREPTQHLGPQATAMERQGKATRIGDENRAVVIDFTSRREAANLRQEAAQVEAEIIELAKEREAREQAKREAREQAKRERDRIAAMSSKELSAEIARIRPRPVMEVAQADPAVIATREKAAQANKNELAVRQCKAAAEQWRAAHPWRARLHRWGVLRNPKVAEWDEWAAKLPAYEKAAQAAAVAERQTWMQTVSRVQDEQIPATQRVIELEMRREVVAERERREAQAERAKQQHAQELAEKLVASADLQQRGKLPADPMLDRWTRIVRDMHGMPWQKERELTAELLKNPKAAEAAAQVLEPYRKAIEREQSRGMSHGR